IAEEKAAIQDGDRDFAQGHLLTIDVGESLHNGSFVCESGLESRLTETYVPQLAGNRIVNFVPLSGSLCTSIVPPCASTIFLTVGNPRPLPPGFVEKNGRKTLASTSADMPLPVSMRLSVREWESGSVRAPDLIPFSLSHSLMLPVSHSLTLPRSTAAWIV